jgi:hypothetical protein
MTQSAVADVVDYFDVDVARDVPLVVGHLPSSDYKYKSGKIDLRDPDAMADFVKGMWRP